MVNEEEPKKESGGSAERELEKKAEELEKSEEEG